MAVAVSPAQGRTFRRQRRGDDRHPRQFLSGNAIANRLALYSASLARLTPDNDHARVERLFRFQLQAFDWNCPQHITPRYSARQVAEYSQTLQQRIQALEQENLRLQQQLTLKGE